MAYNKWATIDCMSEFLVRPKPSDFFELPKIEEQGIVLPKITDFIEVPEKKENQKDLINPPVFTSESNKLLLGYKGKFPVDVGFVYAPYIPIQSTTTLVHPKDLHRNRGMEHEQCTMSEFERCAGNTATEKITSSIGKEIQNDIDREILEKIRSNAQKYYGTVNIRSG